MNLTSASLCSKKVLVRLSSRILDSFPNQINPNCRFIVYPINQIRITIPPDSQASSSSSSIRRFSKMVGGSEVASIGGFRASSPIANGGEPCVSQFRLSPASLLKIQKGDITRWSVDGSSDAIVNPANERMLGGGGADGAIHRAAGPELRAACYDVPEVQRGVRCPTGEARITLGFRLPASHVIHTVGPIYYEADDPAALLRNAYRNSLRVAREKNIQYVAFPAISCGVYGYPYDEAATVAISTVREFGNDIKEVHFVLYADDIFSVWLKKAAELLQN